MKKHLIAAAVAGALAVPAMAQVTISGRIDTSVMAIESNTGADTTKMQSNVLTTNQIVISGSEDLGGGLKATFRVASNLSSDDSRAFTLGDRGSEVGLSGGFGTVMLGKPSGTHVNNSVNTAGFLGNLTPISAGATNSRPANSITYKTPNMSGFGAQIIHSLGAETDPNTGEMTEVTLSGSAGPVKGSVSSGKFKDVGGTDVDEVGLALRANLGMASLDVRYLEVEYDVANAKDSKGYGVGVSFDVGSGLTAVVEYTDIDYKSADTDVSRVGLALIKTLSKRTNVYAAYYSDKEDGAGKTDGNGFGVGVRHSF